MSNWKSIKLIDLEDNFTLGISNIILSFVHTHDTGIVIIVIVFLLP